MFKKSTTNKQELTEAVRQRLTKQVMQQGYKGAEGRAVGIAICVIYDNGMFNLIMENKPSNPELNTLHTTAAAYRDWCNQEMFKNSAKPIKGNGEGGI